MRKIDVNTGRVKEQEEKNIKGALEEILREGARKMLVQALEHEIDEYIEEHRGEQDNKGHRVVARYGYHKERKIVTGIGQLKMKQPRAYNKKKKETFTSKILPPYMRRIPSINNLIPILYLKGISTGDFSTALTSILGEQVKGLSATNIVRLKQVWEEEYKKWSMQDMSNKKYVYIWVDGIYFNVRLDEDRQCILVMIGATEEGKKELIGIQDGYRESKQSWKELLLDIKARGLAGVPKLAIGDGGLGFWSAKEEVFPEIKNQRCWVHKTANILDKLPKSVQGKAKTMIHNMYLSPTKKDALASYEIFIKTYDAKYPKATNCLIKDKEDLFNFYDFPAEQWQHIRTTNPIESTFATVRLRTKRTKGCGSRIATLTMVFKLVQEAEKHWQRLRGYKKIGLVIEGREFVDGILKAA